MSQNTRTKRDLISALQDASDEARERNEGVDAAVANLSLGASLLETLKKAESGSDVEGAVPFLRRDELAAIVVSAVFSHRQQLDSADDYADWAT